MNEDKDTRHRRLDRRLQVLHAVGIGVLLVVLAATSSWWRLPGWPPVALDVLCFAAVVAALALVSAPVAWLREARLRQRRGAAAGEGTWARRHVWEWGLSLALALPVWLAFCWLQRTLPWLVVPATTALVVLGSLVMLALAPSLVIWSPRVSPLADEALTGRLHALVGRAGLRIGGVYAWRDGPFVAEANAALLGGGPGRRLLLSEALLAQFGAEEIDVVVAHELGHHAHGHIWRRLRLSWGVAAAAAAAAQVAALARGVLLDLPLSDPRALPWCLAAVGLVALAARPRLLAVSRTHEIEADAFALRMTGRPDVLERVLARMGAHYRATPDPSPFEAAFFLTHPPVRERVERARAWRAEA